MRGPVSFFSVDWLWFISLFLFPISSQCFFRLEIWLRGFRHDDVVQPERCSEPPPRRAGERFVAGIASALVTRARDMYLSCSPSFSARLLIHSALDTTAHEPTERTEDGENRCCRRHPTRARLRAVVSRR